MTMVNTKEMLKHAQEGGFAIPAFNIHNLETIQGVIEAAVELNAPVIIQTTPGTVRYAGLEYVSAIVRKAAEMHRIPIALHLDHCGSREMILQCLRAGYTSIMVDGAELSYDENVNLVKEMVEIAHVMNVEVEGEIGRIGGVEDDLVVDEAHAALTIPSEAKQFAEDTTVDSLAVAIGTAHGMYKGVPKLDFDRLSEIRSMVDVPLVLHGASGLQDEQIIESVKRGITKVNIATELKNPFAQTIRERLKDESVNDPRKYLADARTSVKEVAMKKIRLCGANDKADLIGG